MIIQFAWKYEIIIMNKQLINSNNILKTAINII